MHLSSSDLNGPIPFHLVFDEQLNITSIGPGLVKLIPDLSLGQNFFNRFTLARPNHHTRSPESLDQLAGRLVLVQVKDTDLQLRGAFWNIHSGTGFLFAATPLMNKAEDIDRLGLILTDFAPHDPVTDFLFAIRARDVTLNEIRNSVERQRLLTRELDHRVKNTLAAVLTLASLTTGESTSMDDFSNRFEGRVRAMAMAHELLATTGWKEVDLKTMIITVLGGFLYDHEYGLAVEGTRATLVSRQAGPLAMAIHELGMNAFKHGAWSVPKGRIEILWKQIDDVLHLTWNESGGPNVSHSPTHGIGLNLVTGFIEHELQGHVELMFESSGMKARIQFPVNVLT